MRYFETRKARIEIIPMIDIMLFLLVFFAMMTLRMIPASGQLSKLPTSSSAASIPAPKLLIEIQQGGTLVADGAPRTMEQLKGLIQSKDTATLSVTIAGSDDTNLQRVMDVIDVVKHSGVTQVGLAARAVAR
ncbi:biopolymer transporter ExbD [Limnohabitans sp.]|uniref:ExbD/TolR family protein n=1 Tax=Limnohabitans sp. TaxID=1907725 RepID=UPI00286F4F32|nr:biopolymer transporter ExbD [Limnohabitans sp.]